MKHQLSSLILLFILIILPKEGFSACPAKLFWLLFGTHNTKTLLLQEPLTIGSRIVVTGMPSPRFSVNIGRGNEQSDTCDIAVHFNVMFTFCDFLKQVRRNTRQHGQWGSEEFDDTTIKSFPFEEKVPFKIEVLVMEKETLWAIDGQYYCRYKHRSPTPFDAEWVQVEGVEQPTVTVFINSTRTHNEEGSLPIIMKTKSGSRRSFMVVYGDVIQNNKNTVTNHFFIPTSE